MENTGSSAPVADSNSAPVDGGDGAVDTSVDGSGVQQAAPVTPAEIKAEIKRINKLKLQVDGREYDEALPFDIPDSAEARDWMTRNLQLSKVSHKRMNDYNKLQGEAQQFIDELKRNPEKILSDPNLGIDLKKFAAKIIEEEISNSQKSPDQLEKEKAQKELKAIKEEREREKQEFQRKESERMTQQAYEQYDIEMTRAIEKSDLPKSPYVVKKMADYLYTALQNGVDLTADEVMPLVREEIMSDIQSMFATSGEEVITKLLGKDNLNKLRKSSIAKAKGLKDKPPVPVKAQLKDGGKLTPKVVEAKKQTFKDFFKI